MSDGVLQGKVAYITGGSRGIGRAIALAFAEAGADVAICHLGDAEQAATLVQAVQRAWPARLRHGGGCRRPGGDAGLRRGGRGGARPLRHPGEQCRASISAGRSRAMTEEVYDRVIDVHVKGMFFMAQAVYAGMVARGRGKIINLASQLALKGGPNITPYGTAKGAIIGFTRNLAWEAAPKGIQVNAIAPGPIETDLTRARGPEWKAMIEATILAGRLGRPEEIAATALLLAGPGGDYYVGATLSPNGGDVMH